MKLLHSLLVPRGEKEEVGFLMGLPRTKSFPRMGKKRLEMDSSLSPMLLLPGESGAGGAP